jgi:formylglycine-generating enzyme required for sulfatase activity
MKRFLLLVAFALTGGCKQKPPEPPCPERMALLPDLGVCIDKLEARVVLVENEAKAEPAAAALPDSRLTYLQAEEACRNSGFRMCTGPEWTRACAGPSGQRPRPYEGPYVAHRCNVAEIDDPMDKVHVAPSGQFASCVTPEGVHDLLGNALEWTNEVRGQSDARELRGSNFSHPGPGAKCVKDERGFLAKDQAGGGFRCCRDATGK